jgi:hypothetical protein
MVSGHINDVLLYLLDIRVGSEQRGSHAGRLGDKFHHRLCPRRVFHPAHQDIHIRDPSHGNNAASVAVYTEDPRRCGMYISQFGYEM